MNDRQSSGPSPEQVQETLHGVVESVVYQNEKTFYTVLELVTDEGYLVTAVGRIPHAGEGEELLLYGCWVEHSEYGKQFSVASYEKQLPQSAEAILRYLSSRTIRGIGPATAKRMVERYGADTFEVIENHPEWLAELPGISMAKAAQIHESFREQTGIRELMMLCRDYLPPSVLTAAYAEWGTAAADKVKADPFCLLELENVSFERVDTLAVALGAAPEAPARILGGIRYLLQYNAFGNGHTCLPLSKLLPAVATQLGVPEDKVRTEVERGVQAGVLARAEQEGESYFGLRALLDGEAYIARRLKKLDRECPAFSVGDVDVMVARLERDFGITYAKEQYEAIRQSMTGGVLILTGGPGTGKTTVIRALLQLYRMADMKVALAAPTGRAAKRMSEATQNEAKTIHRMLEMERTGKREPRYHRDASNPLEEKVVIVDEVSMMDVPLMEALLRALPRGARLILIGDADQLPSVGAGNVLCDLIDSGAFATVRLTRIYRQGEESLIVTNAHRINEGQFPELSVKDKDFFFLPSDDYAAPALLADLWARRLPKAYGQAFRDGIQIITPSRKGRTGTEALNRLLQERLNPKDKSKKETVLHSLTFREGDRVMQMKNNYDISWQKNGTEGTGVFNGDIGQIAEVNIREETLLLRFDDDREAEYSFRDAADLEHAWAITVHKSQGSEYPCVILPVCACPPMLQTRNLLYTAVTRARSMVILVGRPEIVRQMVENDRHVLRYTTLRQRCRNADA